MKTKELNSLVETFITNTIKDKIIESIGGEKSEKHHIICNGEPIDSFDNEDEAKTNLEIYKKEHPDKEFIIEKGVYESHDDMLDKLDEMGEKLEENQTEDMEKKPIKVKSLAEAIMNAKERGIKKIRINNETYDVNESWSKLEEGEGATCGKCGKVVCECGEVKEDKFDLGKAFDKFKKEDEEGECNECGDGKYDLPEGFDEYVKKMGKKDKKDSIVKDKDVDQMEVDETEDVQIVKESGKKKKVKLKESEFIKLISEMVNNTLKKQTGVPGISVTKKAQDASKKENESNSTEVGKKLKDYLNFDGNDNPEFPHQIGGDKMAIQNTDEQDEIVADNRGSGVEDAKYDIEPNETFKERAKEALEGSSKMGNPKDAANAIDTKLGEKIGKKIDRKKEKESKEMSVSWGHDWKEPAKSKVVNEEIEKMKKLSSYDKKTQ